MTDAAMEAAARALKEHIERQIFLGCGPAQIGSELAAQTAITAWLAAEDEERAERAARALFECEKEERGDTREFEQVRPNTRKMYRRYARAAIKALSE